MIVFSLYFSVHRNQQELVHFSSFDNNIDDFVPHLHCMKDFYDCISHDAWVDHELVSNHRIEDNLDKWNLD